MQVQVRNSILKKAKEVEEIMSLLSKYHVLGIVSLHKVRAQQLQEIRRKLEGITYLKVYKNTLVRRALKNLRGAPSINNLWKYMQGPNIYMFTNYNPFKLAAILDKNKVKVPAKAGDVATKDIIVPAGNTGLPPGPIISQLNAAGILTRIESGSVWIVKDTIVAREGEVISESLASVLSKLGLKPIELGLTLKAVYDNGIVIPESDLKLNLEEYKESICKAHVYALNLAINSAYPMPETIAFLLNKAIMEARSLALNAGVFLPDVLKDLLLKAHLEASALDAKIREKNPNWQ
ncbi:MAG: 50S ribosomal protein L10 [Candidatus Bathyarchaeia archaeon]